ncbi:MAG: restriction endonuclease, partial [Acidobacteriota bacterium]
MRSTRDLFQTVHTEGGLLPSDLLERIAQGDKDLEGLAPDDFHLVKGERINEVITRSWNRLLGAWAAFHEIAEKLAPGAADAGITRERWLLILFQELGYGRLEPSKSRAIDGRPYPISHFWHLSPIHLVGFRTDLDTRTKGVAGAARQSPHSLVQEFLNRSEAHLWGFAGNGLKLRILRDNASLTRQAFVEFDLEAMMLSEIYADFRLLWEASCGRTRQRQPSG